MTLSKVFRPTQHKMCHFGDAPKQHAHIGFYRSAFYFQVPQYRTFLLVSYLSCSLTMTFYNPSPILSVPSHLHCSCVFHVPLFRIFVVHPCLSLSTSFLLPLALQCITLVGNLLESILLMCPNHLNLPHQILSHTVSISWS